MLSPKIKETVLILLIGLISVFSSVFFAKPWTGAAASLANDSIPNPSRDAVYLKKADLVNNMHQFEQGQHEAKLAYRLTVPVIMRIFNLNYVDMYYLQLVLGVLIIFMLAFIAFGVTQDYLTTLLISLACSCTFFCRSYFMDTYISFDTYPYFFFTLAILCRKKAWLLIPTIIILFFADERGALAISIVWLCIKLLDRKDPQNINFRELFSLKDNSLYLLIALVISVAIRMYLHWHYALSIPGKNVNLAYFFISWKWFQLAIWSGIEGFWGLFLMVIALAFYRKNFLFGLLLLGVIAAFTLGSAIIEDRTKSIAYLLPLVFICVRFLYYNSTGTNKLLFMVMAINMLYPGSINPTTYNGIYFYPYAMDWFFQLINSMHGVLH